MFTGFMLAWRAMPVPADEPGCTADDDSAVWNLEMLGRRARVNVSCLMFSRRSFLEKAVAAGTIALVPGCSSSDAASGAGPSASNTGGSSGSPSPNPSSSSSSSSGTDGGPPTGDAAPPTESCIESEDNPLGPYYTADAPVRTTLVENGITGTPLVVEGYVLGLGGTGTTCATLARAEVDVWQADDAGTYDNAGFKLRGVFMADASGKYRMETILPGRYLDGAKYRPRHIHVRVRAPGRTELVTQLYFDGDPYNATDGMFKPQLSMKPNDDGKGGLIATFHFVLR